MSNLIQNFISLPLKTSKWKEYYVFVLYVVHLVKRKVARVVFELDS